MQPRFTEPKTPQPGDLIAGKYRLTRPIGLGAMGLVFEAEHLRMRHSVAIKFMQPRLIAHKESVVRFEREGRAASRLTSPHAMRIFDVDATEDGLPYIVSELLSGRDLRQELDERGKLPIVEAATWLIEACAAMAEAHADGIVHRDLKPSNLFLATTNTGRVVKVLDFGVSKMEEELELTTTGTAVGSPRYMSPEQVQAKRVDGRADLWSLGVILYRSISGEYPFDGSTSISLGLAVLTHAPRDIVPLAPECPPGLVAAIKKALERDLEKRYATARDFAEALAPFASPDAASLARSLTREVRTIESSRSSLRVPTPLVETMTAGQPQIDALLDISVDPPEQATRGTWSEASSRSFEPPPARPSRRRPASFAAGVALVVTGAVLFSLHRSSGGDPAPAETRANAGAAEPSTGAAAADPVSSPTPTPSASVAPAGSTASAAASAAPSASALPRAPRADAPARSARPPASVPSNRTSTAAPKNPTYL